MIEYIYSLYSFTTTEHLYLHNYRNHSYFVILIYFAQELIIFDFSSFIIS